MNDLEKVLSSRTPAEQVQAAEDFNKANRSKLISSKKGTLYLRCIRIGESQFQKLRSEVERVTPSFGMKDSGKVRAVTNSVMSIFAGTLATKPTAEKPTMANADYPYRNHWRCSLG
ncbi:hypothetical protein [Pseudomonas aeruginosa]|uniref:hypothetical protein n=1 Tax=Pseudomonas aeruginosa TaxID=287 RepID=UPI0021B3FF60|nr:hypothetical protein [Pseudomonas aeruginosa]MCT7418573.1 hypothetical protein [Pseudomonas aeruginosa]